MRVTINKKSTTTNHRLRTDSSLSHRGGGGGLNAFYWYQIFALDSAVVEVHEMYSSHRFPFNQRSKFVFNKVQSTTHCEYHSYLKLKAV